MAIKIDSSPSQTAVIQCDDCPNWSAVRFGCCEAHRCAVDHEKTFHAESETARWAARKHAQRHTADAKAEALRHAAHSQDVQPPSAVFTA